MFDLKETFNDGSGLPVIKVIGLGGGGGNAVEYMVRSEVEGVEFICANTDVQALNNLSLDNCIKLGSEGLGAGADPLKGMEAAKQNIEQVKEAISGADMLFITAGMGGGTGTGSAPVVAQAAREMGILTVGIVSKPFAFERRSKIAEAGIKELSASVDSLISVPNDKLLKVLGRDFILAKSFDYANEILHGAVQGISELVTKPGLINVDFKDLRTVMTEHGVAMMGVGYATGEDRAIKAVQKAIANPLLEDIAVSGARGLLVNITSGLDFTLGEFNDVGDVIDQVASEDAKVIIGTSIDDSMTDEVRVTVVATGLDSIDNSVKSNLVKPNLSAVATNKAEEKEETEQKIAEVFELTPPETKKKKEILRPKMVVNGGTVESGSNYLDIPAFLRRQAD
jgi:cell division protein FtsZ